MWSQAKKPSHPRSSARAARRAATRGSASSPNSPTSIARFMMAIVTAASSGRAALRFPGYRAVNGNDVFGAGVAAGRAPFGDRDDARRDQGEPGQQLAEVLARTER